MIPFCDLVLCTEADVDCGRVDDFWPAEAERLHTFNLTPEKLAALQTVLGLGDHDSSLASIKLVYSRNAEEGPWLYRIPEQFLESLRSIDDDQHNTITKLWWRTDAFRKIDELEDKFAVRCLLEDIRAIANRAKVEGKRVYLFHSLGYLE